MTENLPVVRASDAERDHVVTRLREASVEGRLTLEEFTDRMTAAFEARTHGELDVLVQDLPAQTAPEQQPPARCWVVSLMGNVSRRGRWRVGKRTFVICSMGNATIDLSDAVIAGPEVSIHVFVSMGNATILVPPGVGVELSVLPLMGNRMDLTRSDYKPGAPLVHISGLVSMGNLFVRTSTKRRRELHP
jgi:hypothetical protein